MTFKEIQELIKQLNRSKLAEFRLKEGEFELTIRTEHYFKAKSTPAAPAPQAPAVVPVPAPVVAQPAAAPAAAAEPAAAPAPSRDEKADRPAEEDTSRYVEIRSPMVGTFYRAPAPDKPPFVKVGDRVEKGQVVCIIEAMKLFNEIESEVTGTIVKVCVEDASPVEYDQVLFLVDPAG